MTTQRFTARAHQRGMSFITIVLLAALTVSVVLVGGRSIPVFIEYLAITKAANKAARTGTSVPEVRAIFDRAAQIDNITSIQGVDLEVTLENDKPRIAFSYSREIPLAGPAFLVYRFQKQIP